MSEIFSPCARLSILITFIAGWVLQFVGHVFEGRRPAFLDDLRQLLIAPLFVVQELLQLIQKRSRVSK